MRVSNKIDNCSCEYCESQGTLVSNNNYFVNLLGESGNENPKWKTEMAKSSYLTKLG